MKVKTLMSVLTYKNNKTKMAEKKVCKKCGLEQNLSNFYKRKVSKDGYRHTCKSCIKVYDKEQSRKYYIINKDRIRENNKIYYYKNREKILCDVKKYQTNNKEKISKRHTKYVKNRKESDNIFKITIDIRNNINQSIRREGYKKLSRTHEILGCSYGVFKQYIDMQFKEWMTFDNHGKYNGEFNYGWDYDHIIPISSAKTEEEVIKLNHYTNFQPLCSHINRDIKKDNI